MLKSGAGLAAIIAAGKAPAALVRSMVAARQSIAAGRKWTNPYQTANNTLIKHYDAEWNVAPLVHDSENKWVNLVGNNEREDLNNYDPYNRKVLAMRDNYVEWTKSGSGARHCAFGLYEAGESPQEFTAVFPMMHGSDFGYSLVFGVDNSNFFGTNGSSFRWKLGNTSVIEFSRGSFPDAMSVAVYYTPTQVGMYNPNTNSWKTASISGVAMPKWGIGSYTNYDGNCPRLGTKFFGARVYAGILSIDELLAFDAVDVRRFGPEVSLRYQATT